jgi:aldose 1-epimerase
MRLGVATASLLLASCAFAGQIDQIVDPDTGYTVVTMTVGSTAVKVVPDAGCNVFSIKYQDQEILLQPDTLKQLRGFRFGAPLLYPTPNRVRDSQFSFGDTKVQFEPNEGKNFLHGLVHSAPFTLKRIPTNDDSKLAIRCELDFAPGTPWYEKFPYQHKLIVDVAVTDIAVRWTYTIQVPPGGKPVPYGFGLHPWFVYKGSRANTWLTIPAANVMDSKDLLPTGALLDLQGHKLDFRKPTPIGTIEADDVYYGMRPELPTVIDYRDPGFMIGLFATAQFTHMVLYTPLEQPYFCVENQTCSTDAHNLYSKGFKRESNLLIAETDQPNQGWIEFRFKIYGNNNNLSP